MEEENLPMIGDTIPFVVAGGAKNKAPIINIIYPPSEPTPEEREAFLKDLYTERFDGNDNRMFITGQDLAHAIASSDTTTPLADTTPPDSVIYICQLP